MTGRFTLWGLSLLLSFMLLFCGSCISKEVEVTETYYATEYRAGYRNEQYTDLVEQRRLNLTPKKVFEAPLYFRGVEFGKQLWGWYYRGYEINAAGYPKAEIVVTLTSEPTSWVVQVVDLTGVGQVPAPTETSELEWRTEVRGGEIVSIGPPPFQKWLDDLNAVTTDPKRSRAFVRSDRWQGKEIVVDATGILEFAVITSSSASFLGSPRVIEKVELVLFGEVTKERQVPYSEPYQVEKQRVVKQIKKVPFWEAIFGR